MDKKYTADELELAWAAGFYDGEGSTFCCTRYARGYSDLRITVGQKERAPLERLRAALGVGSISGPYSNGCHHYVAQGARAEDGINALWPYLSPPKREQASAARAKVARHKAALQGGQLPLY